MNKRNWISALLAVMMVISMMACIVVPAAAAGDFVVTFKVLDRTNAQTETFTVNVDTEGKLIVDSAAEAKLKANNWIVEGSKDEGDVMLADADWSAKTFAADAAYTVIPFADAAATDDAFTAYQVDGVASLIALDDLMTNDTSSDNATKIIASEESVFITANLDVAAWEKESGKVFKTEYAGLIRPLAKYCRHSFNIYGLGHTISNIVDDNAFLMGSNSGIIEDLIFDNINITASTQSMAIVANNTENGWTLENVHIRNSNLTSTYASEPYMGAFVGNIQNGANKFLKMTNCSTYNVSVTSTASATKSKYIALWCGRTRCGKGVQAQNCIAWNCSVNMTSITGTDGFLFGISEGNSTSVKYYCSDMSFDNIAVLNCNLSAPAETTANQKIGVIIQTNGVTTDTTPIMKDIYSAGNTITVNGVSRAFDTLMVETGTTANYSNAAGVKTGTDVVDENIKYHVYNSSATNIEISEERGDVIVPEMDAFTALQKFNASSNTAVKWGFDANGNIVLLQEGEKAPAKVTFTADGNSTSYYTDLNGKIRVVADENGLPALADAAAIAALADSDWRSTEGDSVVAGTDWSQLVITEDVSYTKGSYPPYTMTLDKATYAKGDVVTATVSLLANSNLAGIQVGFNYDETLLTPVEKDGKYATAASGWMVEDAEAAATDCDLAVYAVAPDNFTDETDVFTVQFKVTQDLNNTAEGFELTAVLEYAAGFVGGEAEEVDINAYTSLAIATEAAIVNGEQQDPYYDTLTPASEATWGDGISEYKIDSVAELIRLNMAIQQARNGEAGKIYSGDGDYTLDNFEPDDVIYLTADLDMADWDYEEFATYKEGVGYVPAKIVGVELASDRMQYAYVENTLGTAYDTERDLFSALYSGLAVGYSSGSGYTIPRFTFDGLGHTINNYKSNYPFFNGNFVGMIKNVTFDNAYVAAKTDSVGTSSQVNGKSILASGSANLKVTGWTKTEDSFNLDNVHINNSTLDIGTQAVTEAGIFLGSHNNNSGNDESVCMKNCSAINTHIVANSDTAAKSYGILAGRNTAPSVIDNIILKDCSITTKSSSYHSLLIGSGSGSTQGWTMTNVAVVDCKVVAENATVDNVAIGSSFSSCTHNNTIKNIYLSGNTFATVVGGEETPATNFLVFPGAVKNYSKVPSMSNIIGDANVVNAISFTQDSTKNKAMNKTNLEAGLEAAVEQLEKTITQAHWRVNLDGSLYLLGQKVTIQSAGKADRVRYTGRVNQTLLYEETEDGFISVDPALFEEMTATYWYDGTISAPTYEEMFQAGYDWAKETFEKDCTIVRVPNASEAATSDSYKTYIIETVSDLIGASFAHTNTAIKNATEGIKQGEMVYIVADLDMADWDVSDWAVDNGNGTYTTKGSVAAINSNYRKYDPNATGILCNSKQEVFATLYTGFCSRNARYTHASFDINGLGHTIDNYYAYNAFIAGAYSGGATISNLTFTNAYVDSTKQAQQNPAVSELWTSDASAILINSIDTFGSSESLGTGAYIDNVHIYDSNVFAKGATVAVLLEGTTNTDVKRAPRITNCSIVNCVAETSSTSANSCGLFVGAWENAGYIKNCYALDSTVSVAGSAAGAVHSFVGSGARPNRTSISAIENVSIVGCTFEDAGDEAPNFGLVFGYGELYTKGSNTVEYTGEVITETIEEGGKEVTKYYTTEGKFLTLKDGKYLAYASEQVTNQEVALNIDNIYASTNVLMLNGMNEMIESLVVSCDDNIGKITFGNVIADELNYLYNYTGNTTSSHQDAVALPTPEIITVDATDDNWDTSMDLEGAITAMNELNSVAEWYVEDGKYVPAFAKVNDTYYRYMVGVADIADVVENATSGSVVEVCGDQDSSTVNVPAGVTLELNGAILNAIVNAEGTVNDNTDGLGGVASFGTLAESNPQMALSDDAAGVDRLFKLDVALNEIGKDIGENSKQYRLKLDFSNKAAYGLLAGAKSGLSFQAVLSGGGLESDLTVDFDVEGYADAVAANPTKNYSLYLNVRGLDSLASDLAVSFVATGAGDVAKRVATTYAYVAPEA